MNLTAIRTLQDIEADKRLATPQEQEILSRYVGWGGLPMAFDPDNTSWAKNTRSCKACYPPMKLTAREPLPSTPIILPFPHGYQVHV